jgi:hypothetical protein
MSARRQGRGVVSDDAADEALPITARRIELGGATKKIEDHILFQVVPIV